MGLNGKHVAGATVAALVVGAIAGILIFRFVQGRAYKALVGENEATA